MDKDKKPCSNSRIPVYVVENHHEVVPYIHRAIGSKLLPFKDITFVHFDSHPDLLIPVEMDADFVYDKEHLLRSISIENWIIPLVYAGHISHIFWLKPSWSNQIQDKTIQFLVGKCKATGTIRTTCKESYFVNEILYAREDQLENVQNVTLSVITLDFYQAEKSVSTPEQPRKKLKGTVEEVQKNGGILNCDQPAFEKLIKALEKGKFILDIDMDFYSTSNPFRNLYSKEQYDLLKTLYTSSPVHDSSNEGIEEKVKSRREQLTFLKSNILKFAGNPDLSITDTDSPEKSTLVKQLVSNMKASADDKDTVDWELLHEAGCTIDESELPHHISSQQEIDLLVQATRNLLLLLSKPVIITISRSSEDDYCPQHQVNSIEDTICSMLTGIYQTCQINKVYQVSEKDPT